MWKKLGSSLPTIFLMLTSLFTGAILMRLTMTPVQPAYESPAGAASSRDAVDPWTPAAFQVQQAQDGTPQGTVTPSPTSSPTVTAQPTVTNTLLPPPTFEPPTLTPMPTIAPTETPTEAIVVQVTIEGLRGAETPTPTSTEGCTPRADWTLIYEVQFDDALARIAERYNTSVEALAAANCIADPNVIVVGQRLRVPGAAHPAVPLVECVPYEVLLPVPGTLAINGSDSLTFSWIGPRSYYSVLRITRTDGTVVHEVVVELRQNETVNLYEDLKESGTFYWYLFPLDQNFQPVGCAHGGPWSFTKGPAPTETPTLAAGGIGP